MIASSPERESVLRPGFRTPLDVLGELDDLRRGEIRTYTDIRDAPDWPVRQTLLEVGIRTLVFVPLIVEDELIGVLGLSSESVATPLSDESTEIARQVADTLAIALQQAHLHERLEQHASELEERVAQRTGELGEIDEALSQQRDAIETVHAELTTDEAFPDVEGNHRTLVQVISNLVSNALKFVEPGQTPSVRIGSERVRGRVRLNVEDKGIGIDPEHEQRIFRVFERLHGGESYPGTGIGLAIVRKGVERMNGQVGVELQPGKGSLFWIELNASKEPS
jgi:signal transduction histidine kinase